MPKSLQQLTIFVSGPSGTESEKAALRSVAEEINRRLEKTHNVTLRVVGWPEDIRPGVGRDIQAEVNRQVGDEFDIFIGLLGSRFGTPTPRAGSGTEEEFERALRRFESDSTSVRVLFYFSRATMDPFTVDIDQLLRVRRFREGLADRGVVYSDFSDTGEFALSVRQHLDALIIDEWVGDSWVAVGRAGPDSADSDSRLEPWPTVDGSLSPLVPIEELARVAESEEDERGALDYADGFHEATEAFVAAMAGIAKETERIGEEIRARTAEADQITHKLEQQKAVGGSRAHQEFLGRIRETVDRAAANLDEFVAAVSPHVEQYKMQNRALFDNFRHVHLARLELGQPDTTEDREALAKMVAATADSQQRVIDFQSAVSGVPALTGKLKRSRRRAAATLGELIAEMSFSMQEGQALLDEMDAQSLTLRQVRGT